MNLRRAFRSLPVANAVLPITFALLQACTVEKENTAPGAPSVSIGPVSPGTGDDLVAVVRTDAIDEQGDVVTYSYGWLQDGVPRTDLTTDTVPASETTKGEVWEVTVTPNDGELDGEAGTASTTILNTPPEVTVAFSSAAPTADEDVVAVPTATDADGDAVTVTYTWTLDGAPDDTVADTITADRTERGQRWEVTVTPADEEEPGTPVSAVVEIENSAPVMLSVVLVPADPFVTDDVVATVESSDADGDQVTYTYTWFVDGTEVQSGESDTLAGGGFAKHELVTVEVVPNDGFDDGEAMVSADAEVLNSLPTATSASIDPATAFEASTLTCVPAGFADADGDPEDWTYSWSVNAVTVSTASTLDGTVFAKGDSVICSATPYDGEESGEPVSSAELIVSNTAPTLASADLSTYAPTESDTITVTLGAATDADGDSISYGYDWYVNGSVVSTSTSLLADRFGKGDSIYVVVTPWDGAEWGSPVTSAVATGANTAPSVSSVTLSPTSAYTDDTLTATVSATDLDGDSVSFTYDWYVDGVPRGSTTSATLDGDTYFDKGQSVYVVVTPSDEDEVGASATSSTVTVLNSAPTAPIVEVTPALPEAGDDLTCAVTSASADADGDTITYTFAWEVDGLAYTAAADSTTSSVVGGTDVSEGEVWTCEVLADDGDDTETATDRVTVDAGVYSGTATDADRILTGENSSDYAGSSVSSCFDVDNDGIDDFIVGAPYDDSGGTDAGTAYVITTAGAGTSSLGAADVILVGEVAGDHFGATAAGIGDTNSDSYDDFVVAAPQADDGGTSAGMVYLFRGGVTGTVDASLAYASYVGESTNNVAGVSVAGAGDVSGNGVPDFVIGAQGHSSNAGAAYLITSVSAGVTDLSAANAILTGESSGDYAGAQVDGAGDVNGDGYDDLLVSAEGDDDIASNSGAAYLVLGPQTGTASLSTADAKRRGVAAGDAVGRFVSGVGDVNNDGYDDVMMGAPGYGTYGAVFIELGPISGTSAVSVADARIDGVIGSFGDGYTGGDGGGDFDGDGYDDIAIGDADNGSVYTDGGAVYAFLGPITGTLDVDAADVVLTGSAASDYFGVDIAFIGAQDGTAGVSDILVGAYGEDTAAAGAGAAYTFSAGGL